MSFSLSQLNEDGVLVLVRLRPSDNDDNDTTTTIIIILPDAIKANTTKAKKAFIFNMMILIYIMKTTKNAFEEILFLFV